VGSGPAPRRGRKAAYLSEVDNGMLIFSAAVLVAAQADWGETENRIEVAAWVRHRHAGLDDTSVMHRVHPGSREPSSVACDLRRS
jgi:hypothetical protein